MRGREGWSRGRVLCLDGPVGRRLSEPRSVEAALRIVLRERKHAGVLCKDEGTVARRVVILHTLARPLAVHDPLPP